MFYTIYKTTNLINGKFYIGKHQTKDLQDDYMGSGKLIKAAIKKYGVDNFHKEILHVVQTEKEMDFLEKILVVPDIETNYNLCNGGKGGWGYLNDSSQKHIERAKYAASKITTESRLKMTTKRLLHLKDMTQLAQKVLKEKYPLGTFHGRNHSMETKLKISKANSIRRGNLNSQFGTCWITNGQVNKKIKKDELDNWLKLGYYKGRIPLSPIVA